MGYEVAHAEAQGFAQQIGWAHNKADLKSSGRVLGLPSDAVPKKGQAPKHNPSADPKEYQGPSPNHLGSGMMGGFRPIKWFTAQTDIASGTGFTSMENKGYNFGSISPGSNMRFAAQHVDKPTGASRCWKERFALMMCARELNSERAANGPCAEEAYFFHRCESFSSDVDLQRNVKIMYSDMFFNDLTNQYNAQAYERSFGWNKFGFSGQKGGVPNPGSLNHFV